MQPLQSPSLQTVYTFRLKNLVLSPARDQILQASKCYACKQGVSYILFPWINHFGFCFSCLLISILPPNCLHIHRLKIWCLQHQINTMPVNNASGGFEIDPVSPSTLMPNIPTFHLHQPPFHCWGTNLILLHVGQPCNANGDFLSQETCPEPHQPKAPDDWSPYGSCLEFELADFLYTHNQMSAAHINILHL